MRRNAPSALSSIASRICWKLVPANGFIDGTRNALLIRTSTLPKFAVADSTRAATSSSSVMSVRTASALCPASLSCLASSSRRSTVRAASTNSAPSRAHRCASVVPSPGPTPLITITFFSSIPVMATPASWPQFAVGATRFVYASPHRKSCCASKWGKAAGIASRSTSSTVGPSASVSCTRHPLPAELQEAASVAQRFDPVGDAGVLVGDHDADLAVRIRLRLSVVQRCLMVDVVQRDVPQAAQLEAEVGRVGHRQRDDQSLIGPQVEMPDRRVLRRQTAGRQARRDHGVDRDVQIEPLRKLQPGLDPVDELLSRCRVTLFDCCAGQRRRRGAGGVRPRDGQRAAPRRPVAVDLSDHQLAGAGGPHLPLEAAVRRRSRARGRRTPPGWRARCRRCTRRRAAGSSGPWWCRERR